ncbi:MAG: DUF4382 domain-containing protein [Bacteriovoracaceae bacterium]|nr:DUF4382 domain-containing protein [Bacteriovoracaceae bacterium]
MAKIGKMFIAFFLMTLFVSCNSEDGKNSAGMGDLKVSITDAPFDFQNVDSASVTIKKIKIRKDSGEVLELLDREVTLDLLKLRNGVTETLADIKIPTGSYDQISLIVSEASVTLDNGEHFPLKVPSGSQSGLKIFISPSITVNDGVRSEVLLDFDLSRSFVPHGSHQNITGFNFKPVIRAVSVAAAGIISGEVLNYDSGIAGATVTVTKGEEVIATAVTEVNGTFKILGVPAGVYDVNAEKEGFQSLKINAVPVSAGSEVTTHFILTSLESLAGI